MMVGLAGKILVDIEAHLIKTPLVRYYCSLLRSFLQRQYPKRPQVGRGQIFLFVGSLFRLMSGSWLNSN
jgi:hypothetical protein